MRITVPNLKPGKTYFLELKGKGISGESEWSRRFEIETTPYQVLPTTPAAPVVSVVADSFSISWAPVTTNTNNETIPIVRYELELVGSNGGASPVTRTVSVVPNTTSGEVVTYDLSFENNVALFGVAKPRIVARVRAVDNLGLKSAWSLSDTEDNPIPGNVTGLTAVGGAGVIDVSWTAPADTDLVGYTAYISGVPVWSGNATRFVYSTVTYTSQTITIKAKDKFQQESTGASASATALSPFVIDTTAPAQPTGISGTITTDNDAALTTYMDVSWSAVADPQNDLMGYQVRYRKSTSGNYEYVTVDNVTTNVRIRGLQPYVDYQVSVQAFDFMKNYSGFPANVTATGATNVAPGQPQAPGVSANTLQIQVTPTGNLQAGGAMPADVVEYEVYASTSSGFTTYDATTMLGKIPVGPAMSQTFNIPASGGGSTETWYVKVRAVDIGGLVSSASPQATSTPGLIANTNIVNATITNAKIADLAVDKLTAGSGVINDFIIKATLTIGSGGIDGYIKSDNWVSNTSGWRLSKSGLEVNEGVIKAAALNIQDSANIIPAEYADFEANNSHYTNTMFTSNVIPGVGNNGRYNTKAFNTLFSITNPLVASVYLASSTTDYNINVEPGEKYIFSAYVWNETNNTTTPNMRVKWSNGTNSNVGSATLASGGTGATATRIQANLTVPAGVTKALVYFESTDYTGPNGWSMDGIQVEKHMGTLTTTASAWKPPGSTKINGNLITTGSIQSNQTAQVWDSTNNAYITDPLGTPVWSINTTGGAVFGDLQVRGRIVIGDVNNPTDHDAAALSIIGSANYVPGETGWIARSDGYAEFRQLAPDSISTNSILVDESLAVGAYITIDPIIGITITDSTNPALITTLSGDGSTFAGQGTMSALTVLGNLSIRGTTNNLGGQLSLSTGVTDPQQKPTVTTSWAYTAIAGGGYDRRGWTRPIGGSTASWVTTDNILGFPSNVQSWNNDGSPGGSLFNVTTGYEAWGGIIQLGGTYYVLVQQQSQRSTWRIIGYNAGGGQVAAWITGISTTAHPSIGTDGTNLLVAYVNSLGALKIQPFTTGGSAGTLITTANGHWGTNTNVTSVQRLTHLGNTRYVVSYSSAHRVYSLSGTTLTRQTTEEFTGIGPFKGLYHDGTIFTSFSGDKIVTHTNLTGSYDFAYAWYDSDNGGTYPAGGTTKPSPRLTATPTRFARWTVNIPVAPPDDGTADGTNTAVIYAGSVAGTLYAQTLPLTEPALSATYSTITLSGTTAKVTSDFDTRPGTVARIYSVGTDGTNPNIDFQGDGSGRFGSLYVTAGTSNAKFGTNGTNVAQLTHGSTNTTVNASSLVTVTHGGTTAPSQVFIQSRSGGHIYAITTKGTTTFEILVRTAADNLALPNGTSTNFEWLAIW